MDDGLQNFVDDVTWEALFTVLTIIYGVGWDHRAMNPVMPPPNNEVIEPEADSPVSPALIDGVDINANIQLLVSGEALNTGLENELKYQISSNTMTEEVLKAYLEKIGVKAVRERKKNLEKLRRMTLLR